LALITAGSLCHAQLLFGMAAAQDTERLTELLKLNGEQKAFFLEALTDYEHRKAEQKESADSGEAFKLHRSAAFY